MIDVPKWRCRHITKREYREEMLETLESIVAIEGMTADIKDKINLAKLSTQLVTQLYYLDNESG